ncbi:antitoxin [Caulobacter radicis]|nr:antitoxin [Caulobacter radicis]
MGRLIAPERVDDKPRIEHHGNMTDGALIIRIDAARAERLRPFAEAAGLSVEEYALDVLRRAVEQPGLEEADSPWNGSPARVVQDNGFGEDAEAYADELDRIAEEALRTGGIPFEVLQARLRNLGQPR